MKFSDHHIQSPLAMIDRTCQVCHRESEETLRNNVYERQRKANEIRTRLEKELASAHIEAKFAWDKGATENEMQPVLKLLPAKESPLCTTWPSARNKAFSAKNTMPPAPPGKPLPHTNSMARKSCSSLLHPSSNEE